WPHPRGDRGGDRKAAVLPRRGFVPHARDVRLMTATLENILRARQGPLTSELVLHPAQFGLGRVPARLTPVGVTTSTCGFCSTGCGLKIHLGPDGHAINLTPDPASPVNLGMACPKGWEALTPLAAADRATTPLLRRRRGGPLEP